MNRAGVITHLDQIRLEDEDCARALCNHLSAEERARLLRVLSSDEDVPSGSSAPPSAAQLKQLFLFNALPFVGFGILDNMLMILAGEYIEHHITAIMTISTMAAAALGNMVSDVFGVGLAHYVELLVTRLGIRQPALSAAQVSTRPG